MVFLVYILCFQQIIGYERVAPSSTFPVFNTESIESFNNGYLALTAGLELY